MESLYWIVFLRKCMEKKWNKLSGKYWVTQTVLIHIAKRWKWWNKPMLFFFKTDIYSLIQRHFEKETRWRKDLQSGSFVSSGNMIIQSWSKCVTMVLFSNPSTFCTLPQSNLEPRGVTAEVSFWYNKIQFGCKKNGSRLWLRHLSTARILLNCWGKILTFWSILF